MPEGSGQGAARPGPARQSTKGQRPRDGKRPDMNQPLSKIATHPQSARAHERARAVMPGGNTRSTTYESPHPLYLAAGSGPFLHDLDGRRSLDLQHTFPTLIPGLSHETHVDELPRPLALRTCFHNP